MYVLLMYYFVVFSLTAAVKQTVVGKNATNFEINHIIAVNLVNARDRESGRRNRNREKTETDCKEKTDKENKEKDSEDMRAKDREEKKAKEGHGSTAI